MSFPAPSGFVSQGSIDMSLLWSCRGDSETAFGGSSLSALAFLRGSFSTAPRFARMPASSAEAGSSFGFWGTSSPRNALARRDQRVVWAKAREVIAENVAPRQVEERALADELPTIRGADEHIAATKIVPRLRKRLSDGAEKVENEFSIKADVVHPQVRDAPLDILFHPTQSPAENPQ